MNRWSTAEGLTPSQASVLGLISARGPIGLAELAELEGLNATMLSRVLGKLEARGLVRRDREPSDLRAVNVEVTPPGRTAHERIKVQRTQVVGQCLENLPPATAASLIDALPGLEALVVEMRQANLVAGA